jgi:signal transduction histidine kinase/ActR/RegA family two-component response regulator
MASTGTTGFRSRLILAGVGLLTLAMVAFSTFASLIFDRYLQEQLEEAAMQQRVLLGAALLAPMLQRDYATVEAVIRESRAVRGVDYIVVFDRQRQLVAADGQVPSAVAVGSEVGDAAADRTFHFSGAIAAGGDAVGHIAFGLSKTLIADARRSLLLGALGVGLIIVLVLSVLFAWISYCLTRPLIALSQATRKMQGGDYSIELPYRGSDEIGKLTDDFRQLAARIQEQITKVTASENLQRHYRQSAEQASQAKSEFLAKMSHEIRTPLHGVLGMLELLQGNHLPLEQREHLQLAARSARHLLQVVDEILDFSKIEAGKMQLEATPFDFGELAGDVVALFSPAAAAKGVTMTLTRENIPAALIGDPTRLRQVLSNLLSNAVKFTEAGHIRLQCAWQHDPQVLHVVLEDSGIGIPADRQQTIFDPFMQSDNSVARTYGGTGLGLSISARIVRLMGGEIEVESSPGQGARFRFSLPLQTATALPGIDEAMPVNVTTIVRADGAAVLVVEDTPVNQTIIRIGLERMGYRVDTAGNGFEAIQKVEQGDYAVVLMDCHMPGMDGYAAATAIRDYEARMGRQRMPIIAVTAAVTGDEQARCRAAGMDDYLSKPFSMQGLDAMLRRHLDAP